MGTGIKNIAAVTASRAEYGLLYPLLLELEKEPQIRLHLLVSGTHLLERYGSTIQQIRQDGMPVAEEIEIFGEDFISDEIHIVRAAARAAERSSAIFIREKYDALIVLGDRYELLGFCTAAVLCRIPIIHIHGGEITEGALDEKIRHAVTKLSSIHFPSTKVHARRIIQMGENPDRVYPVGALGIDNIMQMPLMEKRELYKELGIEIETKLPVAVVTYHPVTGQSPASAGEEMRSVLDALLASNVYSVVTMPGSDAGGDFIYQAILEYAARFNRQILFQKNLGQLRYLSLMKCADIMVGNSSSGILESASFRIPAVNIGDRQKGRMAPKNVIHCPCLQSEIEAAVHKGLSQDFRDSLQDCINPYGDGKAAQKITAVLRQIDFSDETLICKQFYDIGEERCGMHM